MEIDTKKESDKVQQELRQANQQLAQIDQQLQNWQGQKQQMVNLMLKKTGELELLERLGSNSKKEKDV